MRSAPPGASRPRVAASASTGWDMSWTRLEDQREVVRSGELRVTRVARLERDPVGDVRGIGREAIVGQRDRACVEVSPSTVAFG